MAFPYEALAKAGINSVRVEYSGEGDEGYINDIAPDNEFIELRQDLHDEIESTVYDILSERYGGWEINEGSQGHLVINVPERKATLTHGTNEIRTTYQTVEVT